MGEQPLTDVTVEVSVDGEPSDRHTRAHRAARGRAAGLGVLGQRRAAVREGRDPRADATRARRGDAGRGPPRRRARARRRARPDPRPGPHLAARAVRRRRRARHARVAGLPAARRLRAHAPPAGGPPGARGGRRARPPPVDRRVVRARRAVAQRGRDSRRSRQQLPVVEPDDPRPLGEASVREGRREPAGRSRTAASSRTSRSSTAPTATSTSGGSTATSATCRRSPPRSRAWSASSASSASQSVPDTAEFMHPDAGRTSTGSELEAAPRPRARRA